MSNPFNKKFVEILSKMDDKMLQTKINSAMDMLKNGDTEDLVKKLNKMDKKELLGKIEELDPNKLNELKIDKNEIRQKVSDADFNNIAKLLGENGDEIVKKFKDIIK